MALRFVTGFIFSMLLPVVCLAQQIGSWQDHLPYQEAIQVSISGEMVLCATPYAIFSVHLNDHTIERKSKVNGLSETGVVAMATDERSGKTVIAYDNGNIDILTNTATINLPQVKESSIAGAKLISAIFFHGEKAYLSTSFGIVLIDLIKDEIKETYLVGKDGNQVQVFAVAADNTHIYAATSEGLKRALSTGANLSDYRSWIDVNDTFSNGIVNDLAAVSNRIIAQKADSVFIWENDKWRFIYASTANIKNVTASSGKLLISEMQSPLQGRIVELDPAGLVNNVYSDPVVRAPQDAVMVNGELWIADSTSGLVHASGSEYKTYQPNSPFSISTGDMVYSDFSVWVASGISSTDYQNNFSGNGFFQYNNMQWKNYLPQQLALPETVYDILSIAVSTIDQSVWIGSLGGGLVRYKPTEQAQLFKQGSGLSPSAFHPDQYRVAGLAFDAEEHLWISNYGAAEPLVLRKADGSWRKFRPPFSLNENAVAALLVDDFNQKWIVSPKANGLLVFNHGLSIDNSGDDQWKLLKSGKGNGNLPDNNVLCITKDKSGFIWVGTSRGIGIIQCASEVFRGAACEALLPVVQQDNFAGYLFSNEAVQHIAVDGADRKWIATKNGAWLITPDGSKTIHHFTAENSPLFSNDIRKIVVHPVTGDVFFATTRGIASFRSTAIEGPPVNQEVKVYPNPVPPGYNGMITIRGVVANAIVKITELDGRLVYQTRAVGGQATWNGKDYRGRQISSGVYILLVSDDSREEKTAGKIVFISR